MDRSDVCPGMGGTLTHENSMTHQTESDYLGNDTSNLSAPRTAETRNTELNAKEKS
ncbi:MAG: hypothetical protein ACFFBD_18495 [Candidatus Hodarchaeota archaeon]